MSVILAALLATGTIIVVASLFTAVPAAYASAHTNAPVLTCTSPAFLTTDGTYYYCISILSQSGTYVQPYHYDSTGRAFVALQKGSGDNPYTITIISCTQTSSCIPTQIWIGGWGPGNVGSPPYTLPYAFSFDATVQTCTTAPLKVFGTSGSSILQIEPGTGCGASVPQFPLGLVAVVAVSLPGLLLMRRKLAF